MIKWLILLMTGLSIVLWAGEDRGLGGTGKYAGEDRGLGGTGVIGTITEFGSIWVNGLEIELTEETQIEMDGQPATEEALRIGQQVAVLATQSEQQWWAQSIQIRHALIGSVQAQMSDHEWLVQGVTVHMPSIQNLEGISIGDFVKISGHFQNGTLVATDVAATEDSDEWQLHAQVYLEGETLRIAAMALPEAMMTASEGEWITLLGAKDNPLSQPYFIGREDVPYRAQAEHYIIDQSEGDHDQTGVRRLSAEAMFERFDRLRQFERNDQSGQFEEKKSPENFDGAVSPEPRSASMMVADPPPIEPPEYSVEHDSLRDRDGQDDESNGSEHDAAHSGSGPEPRGPEPRGLEPRGHDPRRGGPPPR